MQILLTLDYELFNGNIGGSINNCLITPLNELEPILDRHNFKITIFVDTCFLSSLKKIKSGKPDLEHDWNQITTQLTRFAKKGHSIQLHLHPQWINAKYEDGKWFSDLSLYKLDDLPLQQAAKLFLEGSELIKEIVGTPPVAFRAGDYCIQKYRLLSDSLKNAGISIDSSVLRNKRTINDREWFDYSKIPTEYLYPFSTSVTEKDLQGPFFEVSIPTYRHNAIIAYLRRRKTKNRNITPWGDGKSSTGGNLETGLTRLIHRLSLLFCPVRMSASIDGVSATFLSEIYQKERRKESPYMLIMGHPKTFTPYYLELFDLFLTNINKNDNSITIDRLPNDSFI